MAAKHSRLIRQCSTTHPTKLAGTSLSSLFILLELFFLSPRILKLFIQVTPWFLYLDSGWTTYSPFSLLPDFWYIWFFQGWFAWLRATPFHNYIHRFTQVYFFFYPKSLFPYSPFYYLWILISFCKKISWRNFKSTYKIGYHTEKLPRRWENLSPNITSTYLV